MDRHSRKGTRVLAHKVRVVAEPTRVLVSNLDDRQAGWAATGKRGLCRLSAGSLSLLDI
jgi:hypothetical protein